jgi:hypothetical protein
MFAVAASLFLGVAMANAQATRTWVSGVGDDANPCSRTAPCKTFAGAISKTAEGGEIDALDPGGFGTVTITKAMTLEGTHGSGFASILNSGNIPGITINVVTGTFVNTAQVILRGLYIQGASQSPSGTGTSQNGINYIKASRVFVDDCHIENQGNAGINVTTSTDAILNVTNSDITNAANGINFAPSAATVNGQIDHTTLQKFTSNGITTNGGAVFMSVSNSNILNAAGVGVRSGGGGTVLDVDLSAVDNNNTAFSVSGGVIRITRNTIYDNNVNFSIAGGTIASAGNNMVAVNGATVPNGTVTQQ